jgi:hypothetical protein
MVEKLHNVGVRERLDRFDLVAKPAVPRGIKHALQDTGLLMGARLILHEENLRLPAFGQRLQGLPAAPVFGGLLRHADSRDRAPLRLAAQWAVAGPCTNVAVRHGARNYRCKNGGFSSWAEGIAYLAAARPSHRIALPARMLG